MAFLGYTADVRINVTRKCATLVLSNLGNLRQWQTKIYELNSDLLTNLEASEMSPINGG